jgi:hypothetical protein
MINSNDAATLISSDMGIKNGNKLSSNHKAAEAGFIIIYHWWLVLRFWFNAFFWSLSS